MEGSEVGGNLVVKMFSMHENMKRKAKRERERELVCQDFLLSLWFFYLIPKKSNKVIKMVLSGLMRLVYLKHN